jgi:hypothetical protein
LIFFDGKFCVGILYDPRFIHPQKYFSQKILTIPRKIFMDKMISSGDKKLGDKKHFLADKINFFAKSYRGHINLFSLNFLKN